jgi:O-antigen biosynthesis protein
VVGLSKIIFYRPHDRRDWEYTYPSQQRPWICGSTLCYRKEFWIQHPFPDMNEGADTVFVWGLNGAGVISLPDSRWLVGIIHSSNTSPKRTDDAAWRPLPTETVCQLLGSDMPRYETFSIDIADQ